MFLNNVHKGVVITYEKSHHNKCNNYNRILRRTRQYITTTMLLATQQAILSMEGYSANIMTKYILPIHTIITNYM